MTRCVNVFEKELYAHLCAIVLVARTTTKTLWNIPKQLKQIVTMKNSYETSSEGTDTEENTFTSLE